MEQLDQRGKHLKNSYSTLNIFLDYGINLCGTGCQTHTPLRLFNYRAVMSLTCRTADNGGHGFLFRHKLDNVHVRLRRYPTWSDEALWQTGLKTARFRPPAHNWGNVKGIYRFYTSKSVYHYWESLKMWCQSSDRMPHHMCGIVEMVNIPMLMIWAFMSLRQYRVVRSIHWIDSITPLHLVLIKLNSICMCPYLDISGIPILANTKADIRI